MAIETDHGGMAPARILFDARSIEVRRGGFGDTPASLRARGLDQLARDWDEPTYQAGPVRRWRIPEAIVHGPYGIITVGDRVVVETLGHIPFDRPGYAREHTDTGNVVCIPDSVIKADIPSAWHAAGGNYFNHYHFLMDIVPRLQLRPFAATEFGGSILTSPPETAWQKHVGATLAAHGYDVVVLGEGDSVRVANLELVSNLAGHGFAPHPALIDFFDRWQVPPRTGAAFGRRLYLSRRDSRNRPLVNESQIIQLARLVGYEVHEVSSLRVPDQIALFRSASHIIAPHGAGLANIVFCRPGTVVCEFQMDSYINWCFRRLAAIRQLHYGCVVGATTRETRDRSWEHSKEWTFPIDALSKVIDELAG